MMFLLVWAFNDTLYGLSGEDTLYGDSGNDMLYGGDDRDLLWWRRRRSADGNNELL